MAVRRSSTVIDREGTRGTVREFISEGDDAIAVVELDGGVHVLVPAVLLHLEDGGYSVPVRWSLFATSSPRGLSIPVLREDLAVGVRTRTRERVRVRRRVVTETREVQTPVWTERVEIEHVAKDEVVERMPEARQEGDVLIVPIVEEVAVVETRLRLREEVRIRLVREKRLDRRTIPLRHHEVEIERELEPDVAEAPAAPGAFHDGKGEEP